jgi:hypothetical protein
VGERVSCGRLAFRIDELHGFTDHNGIPVTDACYDHVTDYEKGLAVVRRGEGDYQLMNRDGVFVGPSCELMSDLQDGLRLAIRAGRCGYLDSKGDVALGFDLDSGGHFGEGEALVVLAGRRIFIDRNGNELRKFSSEIKSMGPLKEGLRMALSDEKWGFVDRDGEWVIPPTYCMAAPSDGGLIPVKRGSHWGLIDHQGRAGCGECL